MLSCKTPQEPAHLRVELPQAADAAVWCGLLNLSIRSSFSLLRRSRQLGVKLIRVVIFFCQRVATCHATQLLTG